MAKKKKAASTKKTTKKAVSAKKATKKATKKVSKETPTDGRKKKETTAKSNQEEAIVKSPWYDSVMSLVSRIGDVPEDVVSLALNQKGKKKAKDTIRNWLKHNK